MERNPDGVSVQAGDGVILLHRTAPEFGPAAPRALGTATAGMTVMVDDVDAHHTRVLAAAPSATDMPYGVREYNVRDPEGGSWSFMTPLDRGLSHGSAAGRPSGGIMSGIPARAPKET